MAQTHHEVHWLEHEHMRSALHAIEERAGVREKHEAFVEYHGDNDLRKLYFSVPDKALRKELIAQCRRLLLHASDGTRARIADAETELAKLENTGIPTPWMMPGLTACGAVWLGYELGSMPGALAGAVGGFFAGNAYVGARKNAWLREIAQAKYAVEELRDEEKRDAAYFDRRPVFSETEEESGAEDEGPQPEPPIHWYARLGDVEMVKQEIAASVSIELENDESWGSRPLHRAAANGNVEVVEALLAAGANFRAANTLHEWLPIHYAANCGCAETIRLLLNAGSPIDALDSYGNQPIHLAAASGNAESVETLLNAGAKVDVLDQFGNQPIHVAANAGHAQIVETLLAGGADANAGNSHGVRPLNFASHDKGSTYAATIHVLETAGAKRNDPEPEVSI